MVDLKTLSPAALQAAMTSGTDGWGNWGSAAHHALYSEPIRKGLRRKCRCGCGRWSTHSGKANGVALITGCEFSVAMWVRDGKKWRL